MHSEFYRKAFQGMKRSLSFLLAFVLLFSAFFASSVPVSAEGQNDPIYDLALDSKGVYLFNTETETVLYEKAQDTRMFPASTTKIMTALVVLDLCQDPKNEIITCPDTGMFRYIIDDGGVHMYLSQGEQLSVYDVLLGLMMNSYCDAADLLAWHFGDGQVSAFIDKMNAKAAELGLENTHFENAHGLHHPNHYSSPKDVAVFFRAALEKDLFREIISTREYTIPANNRHRARPLKYTVGMYYSNHDYYLDAFVGGKSGFTDQAGRCLVTYSEKDGVSYISVLLGPIWIPPVTIRALICAGWKRTR
jgi:D-alanyl-D-alanine carboxypeptidase